MEAYCWPLMGHLSHLEATCVDRHPVWCVIPVLQFARGSPPFAMPDHPAHRASDQKEC